MVSSIVSGWLKLGVTIEILGQGLPSGWAAGNCGDSTVQGQPCFPAGGDGSSCNWGHRIKYYLSEPYSFAINQTARHHDLATV